MNRSLVVAVRRMLRAFGLQVSRVPRSGSYCGPKLGMEVCLRGLAGRGFEPVCVVDIGAARGTWTRMALRVWPSATYLLIEPLHERTRDLVDLNRECPNVTFIQAGAGSQAGELLIGVSEDLDGSSFLYDGMARRKVPVVTVDDLVGEGRLVQPQLMKLDVQGYELAVLEGAKNTMRCCDLIVLELQFFRFSPTMQLMHESIAWMVDAGWRPYEIVDVARRPLDGAMGQCDILFAREGHWLLSNNSW